MNCSNKVLSSQLVTFLDNTGDLQLSALDIHPWQPKYSNNSNSCIFEFMSISTISFTVWFTEYVTPPTHETQVV